MEKEQYFFIIFKFTSARHVRDGSVSSSFGHGRSSEEFIIGGGASDKSFPLFVFGRIRYRQRQILPGARTLQRHHNNSFLLRLSLRSTVRKNTRLRFVLAMKSRVQMQESEPKLEYSQLAEFVTRPIRI